MTKHFIYTKSDLTYIHLTRRLLQNVIKEGDVSKMLMSNKIPRDPLLRIGEGSGGLFILAHKINPNFFCVSKKIGSSYSSRNTFF